MAVKPHLVARLELLPELVRSRVAGLDVLTDTLHYLEEDRVLPIIENEQPLICDRLKISPGDLVVDAGTGSGVLALVAASRGARVLGVDVLARAVSVAQANAEHNNLTLDLVHGPYSLNSVPGNTVDLVVFNPPHNPTPPGVKVAVHANGGEDGLEVFRSFLAAAEIHVKRSGRIVFFQLTSSRKGMPRVFEDVRRIFGGKFTAEFSRILPTVSYEWFLNHLYQSEHRDWIREQTQLFPDLDLILGEIRIGGSGVVSEGAPLYAPGATWDERVKLHREIVSSSLLVTR